jgi:4-hydroxybenzoate polyprenyltransferase
MLAGAPTATATRLAVAMFGIQCSIGALNDLVDERNDARQKPAKPIPSGLVGRRVALAVTAGGAIVGLVLSAVSGWATAVAGLAGLALGWVYDVRLSRTVLSWLPLSLALPLLPIHAWLGTAGTIPGGLLALVPVGILAGGGLALSNGLVDVERDASAGRPAAAVALGPGRAWVLHAVALACAAALAVGLAPVVLPTSAVENVEVLRALRVGGIAGGIGLLVVGAVCLAARQPGIRERGWELEALGVAGLGIGWLAGTAASALGGAG